LSAGLAQQLAATAEQYQVAVVVMNQVRHHSSQGGISIMIVAE
jgi:hypothetical protein